jgi:hypothetical protein
MRTDVTGAITVSMAVRRRLRYKTPPMRILFQGDRLFPAPRARYSMSAPSGWESRALRWSGSGKPPLPRTASWNVRWENDLPCSA